MNAAREVWPPMAEAAGLDPARHVPKPIWRRDGPSGTRLVLRIDGPGRPLVLKLEPDMPSQEFEGRIGRHMHARSAFVDARDLDVPRLLVVNMEARATLMEFARGRTAHRAMLNAPDGTARLEVLRACAVWAGHLHRSGVIRQRPIRPEPQIRELLNWRRMVTDGSRRVADPAAFLRTVDAALASAEAAAGRAGVEVLVHGDLGLRNLLLGPNGKVTGIDLKGPETEEPGFDLARLLVTYPTFLHRFGDDAAAEIAAAFAIVLDGYGADDRAAATMMYHLHHKLVKLWLSMAPDVSAHTPHQARRLAGIRFLADLLADLD